MRKATSFPNCTSLRSILLLETAAEAEQSAPQLDAVVDDEPGETVGSHAPPESHPTERAAATSGKSFLLIIVSFSASTGTFHSDVSAFSAALIAPTAVCVFVFLLFVYLLVEELFSVCTLFLSLAFSRCSLFFIAHFVVCLSRLNCCRFSVGCADPAPLIGLEEAPASLDDHDDHDDDAKGKSVVFHSQCTSFERFTCGTKIVSLIHGRVSKLPARETRRGRFVILSFFFVMHQ